MIRNIYHNMSGKEILLKFRAIVIFFSGQENPPHHLDRLGVVIMLYQGTLFPRSLIFGGILVCPALIVTCSIIFVYSHGKLFIVDLEYCLKRACVSEKGNRFIVNNEHFQNYISQAMSRCFPISFKTIYNCKNK